MSRAKGKKPWRPDKKIQVVTTYLALGNAPLTSAVTGVPSQTIKQWKMQPWWNDLVEQIRSDDDIQTDAKLTKIIGKSLDVINDRIENGEFQYDPKTGQVVRVPVKLRDVQRTAIDLLDHRSLIRQKPEQKQTDESVNDRLLKIAEQFAKFVTQRTEPRVIEGEFVAIHDERQERLQERIREVSGNTGTDQTPSGA